MQRQTVLQLGPLSDPEKKALARIEMKYSRWIPPERLQRARERHFHYIPDEEFDRQLRASDPGLDQDQVRATQGFYAEGVVHVRRNRESLATNMHERLHSVADPRAGERLGNFLYEGMTEEMANWQHDFQYRLHRYERLPDGRLLVRDPSNYYPENKKTFLLLATACRSQPCWKPTSRATTGAWKRAWKRSSLKERGKRCAPCRTATNERATRITSRPPVAGWHRQPIHHGR